MKELNEHIKDKLSLPGDHQNIKQLKLLASFILKKGMKVWELNYVKGEIKEVEYKTEAVTINGRIRKQLMQQVDCIYTAAINKKNAERKFRDILLKVLK